MAVIVKVDEKKGKIYIEADIEPLTPSASGKTLVVVSTRGNLKTDQKVGGKFLTVGLNAYVPIDGGKPAPAAS